MTQLPLSYYLGEDVVYLAQDLLGKIIISDIDGQLTKAMITETEAYRAPEDKASHAFANKKTKRTQVMFGQGGQSYVYLCYGIHHLCNVVTGPLDMAHAVLIRAVQPIVGIDMMRARRKIKGSDYMLTNGPGKWTMAMGISTIHNDMSYHDPKSAIRIYDAPRLSPNMIVSGPRVGVGYAEAAALWPWRYYIKDSKWVSKPLVATYPDFTTQ